MKHKKRGAIFFTLDTMIAGLILGATILMVISFQINKPVTEDTFQTTENVLNYLTETNMKDVAELTPYIYTPDEGEEIPENTKIHEYIAKLKDEEGEESEEEGKESKAEKLAKNIVEKAIPETYGIKYTIKDLDENERTIYEKEVTNPKTQISRKIITTYESNTGEIKGPYVTTIQITT